MWDDTQKSRSVIQSFLRPMSVEVVPPRSLREAVRDASFCFDPCLCNTSDVPELSDWLMRDPCSFVHETRLSAVFKAPSLPSGRSHC